MTIMVQFISLFFLYILLTFGFSCSDLLLAQIIINNTEDAPFGIQGASIEPEKNLASSRFFRVRFFLLEIKW